MRFVFTLSLFGNLALSAFIGFSLIHGDHTAKKNKYQICKAGIPAGEEVPLLAMVKKSGDNINLAQLRGKMTLISFWALWCEPCLKEQPQLEKFYQKFHTDKFTVVGINLDDQSKRPEAIAVASQHSFENFYSSMRTVSGVLFINSLPTNLLIDSDGRLIKSFSGFSDELFQEIESLVKSKQ